MFVCFYSVKFDSLMWKLLFLLLLKLQSSQRRTCGPKFWLSLWWGRFWRFWHRQWGCDLMTSLTSSSVLSLRRCSTSCPSTNAPWRRWTSGRSSSPPWGWTSSAPRLWRSSKVTPWSPCFMAVVSSVPGVFGWSCRNILCVLEAGKEHFFLGSVTIWTKRRSDNFITSFSSSHLLSSLFHPLKFVYLSASSLNIFFTNSGQKWKKNYNLSWKMRLFLAFRCCFPPKVQYR